jgi:hypothetical protein
MSQKSNSRHSSKRSHHSRSLKDTGKRSFTINNAYHVDGCPTKFSHGDFTGRFLNYSPQRAAGKALKKLCKLKRIKGQCTLYIEMKEITQGSKHNIFAYHCKRIHLKEPRTLPNGITQYYFSKIKPVERVPTEKCPKSHKTSGRMIGYRSKILKSKSHHTKGKHHTKKSMTQKASNAVRSAFKSVRKTLRM